MLNAIKETYLKNDKIKSILNEQRIITMNDVHINMVLIENNKEKEKEKWLKQKEKNEKSNAYWDFTRSPYGKVFHCYEKIDGEKISVDIKEIFKNLKEQTTKKFAVLGQAGIGKSTFCQYVTYKWAKGDHFWSEYDQVILIPLRKLTDDRYPQGKEYLPIDIINKEYFSNNSI